MRGVEGGLVEQNVAEAAAEHDAEGGPSEEIVGLLQRGHGRGEADHAAHDAPADDQGDDVGHCIPADQQRAQMQQHRVEVWEDEDGDHGDATYGMLKVYRVGRGDEPGWIAHAGVQAMSDRPRFFDDIAGVAGGAFSALTGLREEIEATVRARIDEMVRRLQLVRREELEAALEMAALARSGQEAAEVRLAALEERVAHIEAAMESGEE